MTRLAIALTGALLLLPACANKTNNAASIQTIDPILA